MLLAALSKRGWSAHAVQVYLRDAAVVLLWLSDLNRVICQVIQDHHFLQPDSVHIVQQSMLGCPVYMQPSTALPAGVLALETYVHAHDSGVQTMTTAPLLSQHAVLILLQDSCCLTRTL